MAFLNADQVRELHTIATQVDRWRGALIRLQEDRSSEGGRAAFRMLQRIFAADSYHGSYSEREDWQQIVASLTTERSGEASWLVRQLEEWPTRVDPEKTTNVEYLMKEAAAYIRLSTRPATPAQER